MIVKLCLRTLWDQSFEALIRGRDSRDPAGDAAEPGGGLLDSLRGHLVRKAGGCFLYVKLLLDFVERGQIVIKSDSFKLLPQSLAELYQLAFNLIFVSSPSYEPVRALLAVCLASLSPLPLASVFTILASTSLDPASDTSTSWAQLQASYRLVSGSVLVTR